MFIEPKFLYNYREAFAPKTNEDFMIPFGKARIRKAGSDVTVISYGTPVHLSLKAAEMLEDEGISAEVIDLRSIAPLDTKTIFESVKKTSRAVIAHEDKLTGGFGGEIASLINENLFGYLDAPVIRVGSKDTPVGFAKNYESNILLNFQDIKEAVLKAINF
jgi:2-oxoisovalerate dehydrogenase E1 component